MLHYVFIVPDKTSPYVFLETSKISRFWLFSPRKRPVRHRKTANHQKYMQAPFTGCTRRLSALISRMRYDTDSPLCPIDGNDIAGL